VKRPSLSCHHKELSDKKLQVGWSQRTYEDGSGVGLADDEELENYYDDVADLFAHFKVTSVENVAEDEKATVRRLSPEGETKFKHFLKSAAHQFTPSSRVGGRSACADWPELPHCREVWSDRSNWDVPRPVCAYATARGGLLWHETRGLFR